MANYLIATKTGTQSFTSTGWLNRAGEVVRQINDDHGWYNADRTFGEDVALLHSEVSEALEAYRVGEFKTTRREDGKPEGMPSELADVLVRLLDTCSRYNIDLEHEFLQKIQFNATRPYRHGNKAL